MTTCVLFIISLINEIYFLRFKILKSSRFILSQTSLSLIKSIKKYSNIHKTKLVPLHTSQNKFAYYIYLMF